MRMKGFIAATILAASPANAKVIVDIQAGNGQQSRLYSGREAVTSQQPSSVVGIMEDREPTKKRISVVVLTLNSGAGPYNFGPENVTVSSSGKAFEVLTYNELVREARNKAKWRRIAGAFAAGANSTAAQNSGYGNGTFSAYGNNGAYVHGNYSSYDGAAAYQNQAIANQENRQMMENIRRNEEAAVAALDTNLQTTTVDPGKLHGGQIVIELPKELRRVKRPTPATITVKVGPDVHTFDAMITPSR